MKKTILALMVSITLGLSTPMHAETWKEWFTSKLVALKSMFYGLFYKTPTHTIPSPHLTELEHANKKNAWRMQFMEQKIAIPQSESQILENKDNFITFILNLEQQIANDTSLSTFVRKNLLEELYQKASQELLNYIHALRESFGTDEKENEEEESYLDQAIHEINNDILVTFKNRNERITWIPSISSSHLTKIEREQEEQTRKINAWRRHFIEKNISAPQSESQILENKNIFLRGIEILDDAIASDITLSAYSRDRLLQDLYQKASDELFIYVKNLPLLFDKEKIACQMQEINYNILVFEYEKEKFKRESCEANKK